MQHVTGLTFGFTGSYILVDDIHLPDASAYQVDWNLYHDGICIRCNIAINILGSSVVLSRYTYLH
jgi:hypothetical protein